MLGKLKNLLFASKDSDPEEAYDLWATQYDSQPDNLMLALDEMVFSDLLHETDVHNKIVADIGCGTGRHWKKIIDRSPGKLIGFDVSEGMLQKLKQKFPDADTHKLSGNQLKELADDSVDLIISTLTIAHIKNAAEAMTEWSRVLRPGGHIILTDYHPTALARGGKRTFKHDGKTVSIENNIHSIDSINKVAGQLRWLPLRLIEKVIDESVKPYYAKQDALKIFDSFKGVPIIYGMLFKKE